MTSPHFDSAAGAALLAEILNVDHVEHTPDHVCLTPVQAQNLIGLIDHLRSIQRKR